jgi:hypothetical protein
MTSSKRALALSSFLLVAVATADASAQRTAQDIETARQLYNQGIELRDKGDVKGALDKFRAAHALGNTPVTGIELCKTYASLKQPVEAREVCLGVARIPPLPQETQRSQEARAEAARVAEAEKPKIGSVRVKLTGLPPGREALVLVDGAAIPPAALGEPRAINPGSHVITAKVGSGAETRLTFDTREGESKDLDVKVDAPPEAAEARPAQGGPAPAAQPQEKKNTAAIAAFAVAGVAGLVGLVTGLKAMSDESNLDKECTAKKCGTEYHDDLSSAQTWGNVSTAFFVISGVAAVGGVIAVLTAPKAAPRTASSNVTPVVGLGGVGLRGSF